MENTTQADVIDMKKVEEFVTKEDLEKQLEIEKKTVDNMRLEINALNSLRDRLEKKLDKSNDFFAEFALLFAETPAFTSIIDSVKEEILQDIDIDGQIKEIIRNDLTVSISDAYCSVDI
tara:strand:+ start:1555 stop:1911 length:357 start_codon:yes stop_codon:yes gene_type:complete